MIATFAVFAFNQEAYVAEAVRGAFAQTLPMEILLSDDCSTDRTFEIMQEMAAAYSGLHKVVVRRNSRNLGVSGHVNAVFEAATSDMVILAAGDDVSAPSRAAELVAVLDGGAKAVHSAARIIGSGEVWRPPIRSSHAGDNLLAMAMVIGATAAYRKRLFTECGPITEPEAFEDLVLAFRATLDSGGLQYVDKPLVNYREDSGITSVQERSKLDPLARRLLSLRRNSAVLRQRLADIRAINWPFPPQFETVIERELAFLRCKTLYHTNRLGLAGQFVRHPLLATRAVMDGVRFSLNP